MTKAIWIVTSIVVVLILIVGGFFLFNQNFSPINNNLISSQGLSNVVNANNKFAIDLYSKYKTNDGNVFFSPYSISSALAMTYEGARGQTAEEMQKVFYFPEDNNTMRNGYANLYAEINKPSKKYKLSTANALWAENDFQFLDAYFNVVDQYYEGKVTNLDFKQDPESSRITINNWVEDKTEDKIKDLIPSGMINSMTRLVLTNAVYFKGEWVKQFNKDDTLERDFKTDSNNLVKVFMMQRTDEESIYNYGENNILQILEMPYSGNDLSMLVILPKENNLENVEEAFTIDKLSDWKNELREQRVNVFLPRFKFETKYFMAEDLTEMGMPTAFDNVDADFSGMTGKRDLAISQVIHQAFVEVNEEGTEAAAATAVIMKETSAGPYSPIIPVFNADHPFIFIIQQKDTGNILFVGRVSNPTV